MDGIKKSPPIFEKLNKSKSMIFQNNIINNKKPSFNYINKVENINFNLFNSNYKFSDEPWKKDKYLNNNGLNENNRYNNIFNNGYNNNLKSQNKNILPKLPNINQNFHSKNYQNFQVNSNKNLIENQIFFLENMTNKLNYINKTLKNMINSFNNNNSLTYINNNPIKKNAINNFDKNNFDYIKLKPNPQESQNIYSTLSTSKSKMQNSNFYCKYPS